mgnify:CR=1 FL=1
MHWRAPNGALLRKCYVLCETSVNRDITTFSWKNIYNYAKIFNSNCSIPFSFLSQLSHFSPSSPSFFPRSRHRSRPTRALHTASPRPALRERCSARAMDLALSDPFEADFPSVLESTVDVGVATCCAFTRKGSVLLVGTASGDVVLWDTAAHTIAARLRGLTGPVISVSSTRDGRYVFASSSDGTAARFDLAPRPVSCSHADADAAGGARTATLSCGAVVSCGAADRVVSGPFPLRWSQLHPTLPHLAVLCPLAGPASASAAAAGAAALGLGALVVDLDADPSGTAARIDPFAAQTAARAAKRRIAAMNLNSSGGSGSAAGSSGGGKPGEAAADAAIAAAAAAATVPSGSSSSSSSSSCAADDAAAAAAAALAVAAVSAPETLPGRLWLQPPSAGTVIGATLRQRSVEQQQQQQSQQQSQQQQQQQQQQLLLLSGALGLRQWYEPPAALVAQQLQEQQQQQQRLLQQVQLQDSDSQDGNDSSGDGIGSGSSSSAVKSQSQFEPALPQSLPQPAPAPAPLPFLVAPAPHATTSSSVAAAAERATAAAWTPHGDALVAGTSRGRVLVFSLTALTAPTARQRQSQSWRGEMRDGDCDGGSSSSSHLLPPPS